MWLENYKLKQWQGVSMQTPAVTSSDAGEDVEEQGPSWLAGGSENSASTLENSF